jgi:hypothetical protein
MGAAEKPCCGAASSPAVAVPGRGQLQRANAVSSQARGHRQVAPTESAGEGRSRRGEAQENAPAKARDTSLGASPARKPRDTAMMRMTKRSEQDRTEPAKETHARQGARMKACACTPNPSNAGERRGSAGPRREVL